MLNRLLKGTALFFYTFFQENLEIKNALEISSNNEIKKIGFFRSFYLPNFCLKPRILEKKIEFSKNVLLRNNSFFDIPIRNSRPQIHCLNLKL